MITILPNSDRGNTQVSWLDSLHSFSFGSFYNPDQMGFGPIRVINEDRVEPEGGFSLHLHENMEIITYVITGTLAHRDSLGTESHIKSGEIQRMTAGTGIQHSEFNPSLTEKVHFLQIWILPDAQDLPPSYEQKSIPIDKNPNQLIILASPDGREGSIKIHQNVIVYGCKFKMKDEPETLPIRTTKDSQYWLQMITGEASLNNDINLKAGDGAGIKKENRITITALCDDTEFLLFEIM